MEVRFFTVAEIDFVTYGSRDNDMSRMNYRRLIHDTLKYVKECKTNTRGRFLENFHLLLLCEGRNIHDITMWNDFLVQLRHSRWVDEDDARFQISLDAFV